MANTDSTLSNETPTESHLIKKFPITCTPFAVWYCEGEGAKWAINDDEEQAIAMAANYEDALKIAKAFRAVAYEEAIKKAEALRGGASTSRCCPHESRISATTLNTEESRAGAMACMEALRIIDRIAAGDRSDLTLEECWQDEDVSITAMQHAAGNHGEFMSGFVAVFAEYAHMFISGGEPNLYRWQPISSMTQEEVKNRRDQVSAKHEEVNHA